MSSKKKNFLFHLHIPKCGGSSINTLLAREYPDWKQLKVWRQMPTNKWLEDTWGTREEVLSRTCISGHFTFHWFDLLTLDISEYELNIITMLRDPIDRLLSLYNYWKESPNAYQAYVQDMSFEEFVFDKRKIFIATDNDMTRRLCGCINRDIYYEVNQTTLDKALHNLKRVSLIGLLEMFDKSVERWSELYDWKSTKYRYKFAQPRRLRKEHLDASLVDRIADYQRFDYELYNYALDRDWK